MIRPGGVLVHGVSDTQAGPELEELARPPKASAGGTDEASATVRVTEDCPMSSWPLSSESTPAYSPHGNTRWPLGAISH